MKILRSTILVFLLGYGICSLNAQMEIFPDLVVMGDDSLLRLDYAGLIPYLTKAFQEQAQSIQKQDELILAQERMYLYSLIIDDKLIDTKRMVLTE